MANETTLPADIGRSESTLGVASQLTGIWKYLFQVFAVGLGGFAIWSAGPGIAEDQVHLGVYTLVTWFLALLIFPWRTEMPWVAPGAMSLFVAVAVVASVSVSVLRLNGVDETGAGAVDWIVWAAIPVSILFSLRYAKSLDLPCCARAITCGNSVTSRIVPAHGQ
ncbi:MAG: hypothetical protein ACI9DC_002252 [Gammaproteobacteria bacterium]|jgi:hypothetical protein